MNFFANIDTINRSLDVASVRQRLISNNIANVETPGYKTMDVSFKDVLSAEQARYSKEMTFQGYRTDPRHFIIGQAQSGFQPRVVVNNQTSLLNNKNNVDIESEMTKLAENNIWYNSLTQVMNKEFSMLRYVVTEGRR